MKTSLFLSIFIMVCVCGYAQDRDEIFSRPPVRGSFYKLLSKDEIYGRGNIVAGKVVSASGILGHVHLGLPYVASATHEAWINIGIRILAATDTADANKIYESSRWYTALWINDVTTWVMDGGGSSGSGEAEDTTNIFVQQRFYGGHSDDFVLSYAAVSPVEVRAFPDRARRFGSRYWGTLDGIDRQVNELMSGSSVVAIGADWWDTKTWFHLRYTPVSTSEFAILTNQDNNPIVGPDDHFILTESR